MATAEFDGCPLWAFGGRAEGQGRWGVKVTGHGKLDPTQFVVRTKGVSIAVAMSEPFSPEAKAALAELRRTMENG